MTMLKLTVFIHTQIRPVAMLRVFEVMSKKGDRK